MEARVKPDYRWKNITAFSGREYVKSEFRLVPQDCEAQARANGSLEVRENVEQPQPEIVTVEVPVEAEAPIEEVPPTESLRETPYVREDWKPHKRKQKKELEE
jgi:hypothetical protein